MLNKDQYLVLLVVTLGFLFTVIQSANETQFRLRSHCNQTEQCSKAINSSICQNHLCQCEPGFGEFNGGCFRPIFINESCKRDGECQASDFHSQCLPSNNTCQCKAGFRPQNAEPNSRVKRCMKTTSGHCLVAKDCKAVDIHSECQAGDCVCEKGFNLTANLCQPHPVPLNATCNITDQCRLIDSGSICSNGKCVCMSGFKETKYGGYSVCELVHKHPGEPCENDNECRNADKNSKCDMSNHKCFCPKSLNSKTNTCNGCASLSSITWAIFSALSLALVCTGKMF